MNDLEKALNARGYYKGGYNKIGGEYLQRWYAGSPGKAEPAKGDTYITENHIVVANPWTEEVYATFDNVDDFITHCTGISKPGMPAWSQGIFDG